MAQSFATVTISGPGFKATAKRLIREADLCVRRATLNIEGLAKRNIVAVNAVDTGFLLNSVYSVHSGGSGYAAATSSASAKNAQALMLGGVGNVRAGTGFVAVGAEYGYYIEFGRAAQPAKGNRAAQVSRAPRPFLIPAFEEARQPFLDDLAGIAGRIKP